MTTIIKTKRTKATIEQIKAAFATNPKAVAEAAAQRWNCEEASCDEVGDVWIAEPMRGHWLDEEEIQELVEWWEAEVGLSVFDQLGTRSAVAALKVAGVSREQIVARIGGVMRTLENKIAGRTAATLAETEVLITMIAETVMAYRITACYERDGQVIDCTQPEVLGEFCGKTFDTLEDAEEAVEELRDGIEDYELDPSTEFEIVRG